MSVSASVSECEWVCGCMSVGEWMCECMTLCMSQFVNIHSECVNVWMWVRLWVSVSECVDVWVWVSECVIAWHCAWVSLWIHIVSVWMYECECECECVCGCMSVGEWMCDSMRLSASRFVNVSPWMCECECECECECVDVWVSELLPWEWEFVRMGICENGNLWEWEFQVSSIRRYQKRNAWWYDSAEATHTHTHTDTHTHSV